MDLRDSFAGRLLTAYQAVCRGAATETPARPETIDLADVAVKGHCVLVGRTLPEARAAIARIAPQTRHSALNLAQRTSVRGKAIARRQNATAAARGVDVRGVYDTWSLTAEHRALLTEQDRETIREGCVVQQLIVLDRRAVLLDGPSVNGGIERSTWLVGDPEVVRMAGGLFDSTWRAARPIGPEPPRADDLTDRQRRIVPLLLGGLSEASIARELGVAERTVSSDVKALMTVLGANGRVDLGYRLRIREELGGR